MRELGRAARTKMQVRVKEMHIEDIWEVTQCRTMGKMFIEKLDKSSQKISMFRRADGLGDGEHAPQTDTRLVFKKN